MSPCRILVVEDNQVVAADLTDILHDTGFEVVGVAESGQEAIRLARELDPDLAVMDISLNDEIDGVEAATQIYANKRLPIVFLTAHGDRKTVERTTAMGAFGHLIKPVRRSELEAAISIALSQHRASQELLEQKMWLGMLLASMDEGIIAADLDGRISYLNPQAEALTGWSSHEAFGKTVCEVYPLASHSGAGIEEPRLQVSARTGIPGGRERFLLQTRKRDEVLIEESVSPLWKDGRVTGAVSIFRDLRETLRLEQAQKLETIGVLAGGVAHDFNNLLAVIIGNASLAIDTLNRSSREFRFLEEVIRSGNKAADLTTQLLAYAGKATLQRAPLNLSRAVREIVELVRTTVSHRVAVSVDVPENLPPILGDSSQIQQVVMNLVINASEAIGDFAGFIDIQGRTVGDPPQLLRLLVRDSGPGMDPETRSRIFDPFFTTKFTGRGLGLAAVHGIIRSHEGTIEVETAPGRGTCFTMSFPVCAPAAAESAGSKTRGNYAGTETILVVDDMESVWRFAKNALERYGYRVLVAQSGHAALEVLAEHSDEIRLVLLDVSMPVMSGLELRQHIRRQFPNLTICLMSGFSEQAVNTEAGDAVTGMSFLQKPFAPNQLAARVRALLDAAEQNVLSDV